jgi:hypothetical protein
MPAPLAEDRITEPAIRIERDPVRSRARVASEDLRRELTDTDAALRRVAPPTCQTNSSPT